MRNSLSTWAIRNPIPPIVMFLLLTVAGLIAYVEMPITNMPNVVVPVAGSVKGRPAIISRTFSASSEAAVLRCEMASCCVVVSTSLTSAVIATPTMTVVSAVSISVSPRWLERMGVRAKRK